MYLKKKKCLEVFVGVVVGNVVDHGEVAGLEWVLTVLCRGQMSK